MKKIKNIKYCLQIFHPGHDGGDGQDPLFDYESDTPFTSFSKGDFIDGSIVSNADSQKYYFKEGFSLKVLSIKHFLMESKEDLRHHIVICTEATKDTMLSESRRIK